MTFAQTIVVAVRASLPRKLLFFFILLVSPSWSATWYISTTGSDAYAGTSPSTAFATFTHALAAMSGCDTLIIENGYYYDVINITGSMTNLSGNVGGSGCYTTIEAATTWGVTLDSSTQSHTEFIGALGASGAVNYIQFIGIKAAGDPANTTGSGPVGAGSGVDHIKFIKVAGYNAPCNNNTNVMGIGPGASYILIEDSHFWGCGRYKVEIYQSDHVILRHSVARHDYHDITGWTSENPGGMSGWGRQIGLFTMYDSYEVLFQNDIGLDSGSPDDSTGTIWGGIQSENNDAVLGSQALCNALVPSPACRGVAGSPGCSVDPHGISHGTTGQDNSGNYEGLIFINIQGYWNPPAIFDDKLNGTRNAVNIAMANTAGGFLGDRQATGTSEASDLLLHHMTAYNITGPASNPSPASGVGATEDCNDNFTEHLTEDSIIEDADAFGLANYMTSNYNLYYDNSANFGTAFYLGNIPTAGAHDIQGTNPQLKYITRVEAGTPGSGTASDGGDRGATILYRMGTPGTLWGDAGYDTPTSISLWPWADEAVIKGDMASFSMVNPVAGGVISGTRGFAAPGNGLYGGPITLTSYIWEALGNPCPGGICPPVVATPSFSLAAGNYTTAQTLSISDSTSGATIYYTTDGSMPTTGSTSYAGPITVSAPSETLSAVAAETGYENSATASVIYTIGTPAATPSFSPGTGSYLTAQTVTISDSTSGATIYYTTNGVTPTIYSTVYSSSSPIIVSATQTLEAIATASGYSTSAVGTAIYTINAAATPTFSPGTGTYNSAQTVTISDSTSGATIYYTTNGVTPTTASSTYSSAIIVSATETLEAIAAKSDYSNSAVGSAGYTINGAAAATPNFAPAPGTYTSAQTVTISDGTSGATIYYTTDGTPPTTASSTYSSAIIVSATETLEAIAAKAGYSNSAVGSAAYTISSGGGSAPVYVQQCSQLDNSNGTGIVSCTLPSPVTAGDALVIGVWSSNATLTSVTSSTTAQPVSVFSDFAGANSPGYVSAYLLPNAASGSITITATSPGGYTYNWLSVTEYTNVAASPLDTEADYYASGYGLSSVSTGNFNTTVNGDMLWSMCDGYGGSAAFYAGTAPITWTAVNSYEGTYVAPWLFVEDGAAGNAGSYYGQCLSNTTTYSGGAGDGVIMALALKGASTSPAAMPTFSLVAGAYGPAQTVTISDSTRGATIYYTTNGVTPTTASSTYSSAIIVSATETLEAIAAKAGYSNSAVGSAAYTINGAAATPTFSPLAGAYGPAQTVTISDSTSGATIYYTTNGTTPTTASSTYSSAIIVSATETLEAIAAKTGYSNSAVGSAAYTIATQSVLTTPPPNTSTPLTGTSVAFSWTPGNTAKNFEFWVGTTAGSSNLYNSGNVTATSETVSTLPNNGEGIYVRLYYLINGTWQYTDYTYKASGSPTPAILTSPTPNSSTPLPGTSVTFSWNPGNLATHFELWVGTSVGSSNVYSSGNVTATSETVSDLPSNGQTLHVRLYSLINGAWQPTDYTYVASGSPTLASLTTPTPNTAMPLSGTSVTFAWTPGNLATNFELWVGTSVGSSNVYNSGNVTATSETVSGLPSNGQTFHVRLYSLINGAWQPTDYTYVAAGSPTLASLTTPTPNTAMPLSGTSVTFAWTPGNLATNFELWVGTSVGSSNVYNSGNVTATSETVSGLPSNGQTFHVRLYSLINGAWQPTDYTYVASGSPTQATLTTPTPNTSTPLTGTSVTFSWTPGNLAKNFESLGGHECWIEQSVQLGQRDVHI